MRRRRAAFLRRRAAPGGGWWPCAWTPPRPGSVPAVAAAVWRCCAGASISVRAAGRNSRGGRALFGDVQQEQPPWPRPTPPSPRTPGPRYRRRSPRRRPTLRPSRLRRTPHPARSCRPRRRPARATCRRLKHEGLKQREVAGRFAGALASPSGGLMPLRFPLARGGGTGDARADLADRAAASYLGRHFARQDGLRRPGACRRGGSPVPMRWRRRPSAPRRLGGRPLSGSGVHLGSAQTRRAPGRRPVVLPKHLGRSARGVPRSLRRCPLSDAKRAGRS
jgi:hypothetical protein